MTHAANPPANPPAGWYDDPGEVGRRYWDGSHWTDSIAPPSETETSGKTKDSKNNTLVVFGYIFAILAPIIGAIIAIPLYSRGDRRATAVLLTSIVAFVLYFVLILNSAASSTSTTGY